MKAQGSMNREFPDDRVLATVATHSRLSNAAFSNQVWMERNQDNHAAKFLQVVIDASPAIIAILDSDQKIRYVNRAWRGFAAQMGVLSDSLSVGSVYPDLGLGVVAACNRDAVAIAAGITSVINKSEIEFQMEYVCTAIAEPVWFRVHAASFSVTGLDDSSMVLVSHDNITKEKQAEDLLVENRERINRLLDSTNILPWEADASTLAITYVGEQAEQMLGYSKEEWMEPDFWINHVHPDDKLRTATEAANLSQAGDQYQYEYRMLSKHGRIVWINDIVSLQREKGVPVTISGFMIDITERKLAEKTLMLLSGRLITAQEDERKRIARELHDDLNQRMALMSIELEQLGQTLSNRKDGVSERIQELQRKALRISKEIHRMSYKLHPSKLDHLGLAPALKSFCSELAERRGMRIDFRHEGSSATLPADITLCLFRVAQEALQNAAKHSGKSRVDVLLKISGTAVELNVSDSGSGFDMNNSKMSEGLGFVSMRERLRLVNGSLSIESRPRSGTRIRVSVPLINVVSVQPVTNSDD